MKKKKHTNIKKPPFWHIRAREYHKHPFFIPVMTFLVLLIASVVFFVLSNGREVAASDSHVVILSHDNQHETLPTRSATVGEFLNKANIALNTGDVVEPSKDTAIDEDNFRINVYRARPVLIIDGENKTFAFSAAKTTRSVAAQVGIKVYPEDGLSSQPETNFLEDGAIGEKVIIDRATPVNLNLYGTQTIIRTHAKTVGDLLKEKNIVAAKDDQIQPAPGTLLTAQSQIFVSRNGTKIETVEEAIPKSVQTVEDNTLSFGTTAIRQQGSDGKKLVTYQIDLVNDKEVGRHVIQTVVSVEPVTQIEARGKAVYIPDDKSSIMASAGISPSDYPYVNYIVGHESGWCPTKLQGHPGACPAYAPDSIPSGLGYGMCQDTADGKDRIIIG
jgi:uncharacterized protein YabE (DUF348 family)